MFSPRRNFARLVREGGHDFSVIHNDANTGQFSASICRARPTNGGTEVRDLHERVAVDAVALVGHLFRITFLPDLVDDGEHSADAPLSHGQNVTSRLSNPARTSRS